MTLPAIKLLYYVAPQGELKKINKNDRKTGFRLIEEFSNNLIEVYKMWSTASYNIDLPISIGVKRTFRKPQVRGILCRVEAELIYL